MVSMVWIPNDQVILQWSNYIVRLLLPLLSLPIRSKETSFIKSWLCLSHYIHRPFWIKHEFLSHRILLLSVDAYSSFRYKQNKKEEDWIISRDGYIDLSSSVVNVLAVVLGLAAAWDPNSLPEPILPISLQQCGLFWYARFHLFIPWRVPINTPLCNHWSPRHDDLISLCYYILKFKISFTRH